MTLETPLTWRLPPRMPEFLPTPTMVVLLGMLALISVSWLAADATRASSCGPLATLSLPQTAGS